MNSAAIVSYARTPFVRSWTGSLNHTHPVTLGSVVISRALDRAQVERHHVDDVILGCANPEGAAGVNIARMCALRADLPVEVPGMTVSRLCASGLQALAVAAHRVMVGEIETAVAGGVESISAVQNSMNAHLTHEAWLDENMPSIYLPMLETAQVVADRYGVSREAQESFALASQSRAARAVAAGFFKDEIVDVETEQVVVTKKDVVELKPVRSSVDECARPDTTRLGLGALRPVLRGGTVTAGTASPLADGAAALVVMNEQRAERIGAPILGRFRAFAATGVAPDEMGIGPVPAVRKLLDRAGLAVADIDLWEMNEAFASQVVYCRDELGIPDELLNVNGGALALGHPYGASGGRLVGHALMEGRRRQARLAVVTMCIGGGQGAAALLEIGGR